MKRQHLSDQCRDDRPHPRPLDDAAQLGALGQRYESRGYNVLAPAWPGMDGEVEALTRSSPIATLDVEQIVDHYEAIIRGPASPPIIMGHSFGGAFTQILLDRGLGAAGVAVAPANRQGCAPPAAVDAQAAAPVLSNPVNRNKAVPLTRSSSTTRSRTPSARRSRTQSTSATPSRGRPRSSSRARSPTSTPRRRRRSTSSNDDRAPLLFIAFGKDHIVPPKVSRHNAEKYADPRP